MNKFLLLTVCLAVAALQLGRAQEDAPVSRAEYERMKAELKAEFSTELKAQSEQFKKELAGLRTQLEKRSRVGMDGQHFPESNSPNGRSCLGKDFSFLSPALVTTPGTSQLTLTGGASATYSSKDSSTNFSALFNPIFLWKINDRLRVEADLDFAAKNSGDSSTKIETAEISYDVCDYLTLGAGRFANPTNFFAMNLRKDWVNKLPENPALRLPSFEDGVQLHGSVPVGSMLLTYAGFVGDSPASRHFARRAYSEPFEGEHFGEAQYSGHYSFTDLKSELEVGGRIALNPVPGLEIGYGVETFKGKGSLDTTESWTTYEKYFSSLYDISGLQNGGNINGSTPIYFSRPHHKRASAHYEVSVQPVIQTLDLNYFKDLDCLKGTIDFHAQWTWSEVNSSEYPDQLQRALVPYDSNHNGGYAQLAYRPTQVSCFLASLEPVIRYEYNQIYEGHSEVWSFGLDYWLSDRTLIKGAYLTSSIQSTRDDALVLQFATGF